MYVYLIVTVVSGGPSVRPGCCRSVNTSLLLHVTKTNLKTPEKISPMTLAY